MTCRGCLSSWRVLCLIASALLWASAEAFVVGRPVASSNKNNPLVSAPFFGLLQKEEASQSRGCLKGGFQRPTKSSTRLQVGLSPTVTAPLLSIGVMTGVVLIHELGHYLAARWFRIPVQEFSVGMGFKFFGFRAWGNDFFLRAFPLGGYVLFAGEDSKEEEEKEANTDNTEDPTKWLRNRPWHERAIVYSGGVVFNLLLSYVLYLAVWIQLGWLKHISLSKLARGTAQMVTMQVKDTAAGIGGLLWMLAQKILPFTKRIATIDPTQIPQVSGPVQILKTGSDIASQQGMPSLLWFASNLSLNLGVLNAFPLPLLDGGRLLGTLFEAITRRKVHPQVEEVATLVTFLLLGWLLVSTSLKDIRFLFR